MAKKILALLAEAVKRATVKDKMCDLYFRNKDLDLVAHELLSRHRLLLATVAAFDKLLR